MVAVGDGSDVFTGYARSDEAAAADLNGWLCAQGFSAFFDRNALRPNFRWIPALEETINRYKTVTILAGKHGIGDTRQPAARIAVQSLP